MSECEIDGCTKVVSRSGLCAMHNSRKWRHGSPHTTVKLVMAGASIEDKLLARITKTSTCWLWTGSVADQGYGRHGHDLAHRLAYETWVGPIPEGLVIDHLCRVRHCVNPSHLEAVTLAENTRRGERGRLVTACPSDHAYTPENTRIRKNGTRTCRECERERNRVTETEHRRRLAHDAPKPPLRELLPAPDDRPREATRPPRREASIEEPMT